MAQSLRAEKRKKKKLEVDRKVVQEIATRIIQTRNSKGLSQSQMGELIGFSQSAISQIESGKVLLELRTLLVLAKKMKVSPHVFLPGTLPSSLFGDSILGLLWLRISYWWHTRKRNISDESESQ